VPPGLCGSCAPTLRLDYWITFRKAFELVRVAEHPDVRSTRAVAEKLFKGQIRPYCRG
jgi:hypothetical protein